MSEAVDLLVELIRNRCVNDGTPGSGDETRSVETITGYLGPGGRVVEPLPGRSSVVYRVPGTDPGARSLLLMGHTDVVPVSEDGWSRDPFGGEVVDDLVWGRGAVDMLNLTAAMAVAFKPYLTGEFPPLPGDLVYLAVADEENGGALGAGQLVEEHWDLVRCDDLLTEIAAPAITTPAGPVVPVTVAEKGPAWRRLRTAGSPGHASQPYATDSALAPLAAAVAGLAAAGAPVVVSPEWRAFVAGLDVDPELAERLTDADRLDEAIEDLAVDDPAFARWAHACTHMTVTPTMLRSGIKANVIPDGGVANVDVRILPGQEQADVDDHFRKVFGPGLADRIGVEPVMSFPPTKSEPEGVLWESVADGVEAECGHRSLVPALIPVATDARYFRERGVVAYGVGVFDDLLSFGDVLTMFHGHDERVGVASVTATERFLASTVAAYGHRTGDVAR